MRVYREPVPRIRRTRECMLQVVGDGSDVAIGGRVRLVLRKYAHERGVPVYGFKAKPVTEGRPG